MALECWIVLNGHKLYNHFGCRILRYIKRKQPAEVFYKKGVLKNFIKFTGKYLHQSLFFNKVTGLPATLLKKRLWHRCFPVNFVKILRTRFLLYTSKRLFLIKVISRHHWRMKNVLRRIKNLVKHLRWRFLQK